MSTEEAPTPKRRVRVRVSRFADLPHKSFPQGKVKRFVELYFESNNLIKSYNQAGFLYGNSDSVRRQEAKKKLREERAYKYLSYLRDKQLENAGVTVEWVVSKFKTVFDAAMMNSDLRAANEALKNLGTYLGMFVTKVESINTNFNIQSEEELDKKFRELAEIAGVKLDDKEPS